MIIKQPLEDYYEKLPSPETFLDQRKIDIEAADIVDMMIAHTRDRAMIIEDISIEGLQTQLQNSCQELLEQYESKFKEVAEKKDRKIKYCEYLHNKIYIAPQGYVVPCCVVGRPILGDINNKTIKEVWNGDLYNDFRRKFYSSNPSDCCKGCINVQYLNWPGNFK